MRTRPSADRHAGGDDVEQASRPECRAAGRTGSWRASCREIRHGTTCRPARRRRCPADWRCSAADRRTGYSRCGRRATTPIAAQTRKSSMSSGFSGAVPGGPEPLVGDQPLGVPPGKQDADDVADAVPMDRQRPDLDDHRIDVRERAEPPAAAAGRSSSQVSGARNARGPCCSGLAGSRRGPRRSRSACHRAAQRKRHANEQTNQRDRLESSSRAWMPAVSGE